MLALICWHYYWEAAGLNNIFGTSSKTNKPDFKSLLPCGSMIIFGKASAENMEVKSGAESLRKSGWKQSHLSGSY